MQTPQWVSDQEPLTDGVCLEPIKKKKDVKGTEKDHTGQSERKTRGSLKQNSYPCRWLFTPKRCKGCMFLWKWTNMFRLPGNSNECPDDTAHGIIGEEKRTKRPLFEKTLTDSAPKYFRRSSFSSLLSSAGKWWTSSVLLQFVWTGSSFILLQDSSKRNGSKLTSQTSNSEQHSPPVSSDNHYLISNLSPKRAISQPNWWCNASWYCLPRWCFWPALCSISKSFSLVPAFAYNHI